MHILHQNTLIYWQFSEQQHTKIYIYIGNINYKIKFANDLSTIYLININSSFRPNNTQTDYTFLVDICQIGASS